MATNTKARDAAQSPRVHFFIFLTFPTQGDSIHPNFAHEDLNNHNEQDRKTKLLRTSAERRKDRTCASNNEVSTPISRTQNHGYQLKDKRSKSRKRNETLPCGNLWQVFVQDSFLIQTLLLAPTVQAVWAFFPCETIRS
ncbi:hypothetical protein VTL71DRAFT_5623 [Oculimacula yallundae]|uniref:Uncharacterized protein n=1 Tax=Oculimacula yallundae TaxID=86028 RepID=A0ABR4C429_9HELO